MDPTTFISVIINEKPRLKQSGNFFSERAYKVINAFDKDEAGFPFPIPEIEKGKEGALQAPVQAVAKNTRCA